MFPGLEPFSSFSLSSLAFLASGFTFHAKFMRAVLTCLVVFFSLLRISQGATVCFEKQIETDGGPRTWAYELGVAFITPNDIENFAFIKDTVSRASGPEGGEIYTFTASRRLAS